jgi:acetyl-CoA carboxylase biotin carboxyl carrier protein
VSLTAKDVAEIMRLLEESTFDTLSLEINGMKLNLQRGSPARSNANAAENPAPAADIASANPVTKTRSPSEAGLYELASPFLGVFYRAPKPGQPPFVEVGSKVEENTVIGIIEVMKLMNSVNAGVKGEVSEILGANGALVEYGEILLRVRPEG